jgi:GNAT superfamily N-acetyltransferase
MPKITIRKAAGEQDIAAVRLLMLEYGRHLAANPSGAASICLTGHDQELERLPQGYIVIFLAEVDDCPAGCVALRAIEHPEAACEMKRLWVGSSFRGLRLGRRLVEEAILWAEFHGFGSMYLDTVPAAMPEANQLYARLGFLSVERYNENPIEGVAFFCRPLGSVR